MRSFIGIEIGGTKLQLALGDDNARILARRQFAVDVPKGASGIREQIIEGLKDLSRGEKPSAIGVGFGGPVDWKSGKICRSHQIEGWSQFDLRTWLEQETSSRVFVDNDANVAALAETKFGAGKNRSPVFYVTLGSGVGGGLVVEGEIYHGAIPGEAELGHVRLDRAGATVESRCAGWAVDARIRKLVITRPDSLLAQLIRGNSGGEAKYLSAALMQADPPAREILRDLCEDLAFGLSHVAHLFHPAMIVIGGGLSNLGEPLREGISRSLQSLIMEAMAPGPEIVVAALAEDAVPQGALELARRNFDESA
jgi:glucokinase